jgi:hypothetical protein
MGVVKLLRTGFAVELAAEMCGLTGAVAKL